MAMLNNQRVYLDPPLQSGKHGFLPLHLLIICLLQGGGKKGGTGPWLCLRITAHHIVSLPSGNQTWQWEITYTCPSKWEIIYFPAGHAWLPHGIFHVYDPLVVHPDGVEPLKNKMKSRAPRLLTPKMQKWNQGSSTPHVAQRENHQSSNWGVCKNKIKRFQK